MPFLNKLCVVFFAFYCTLSIGTLDLLPTTAHPNRGSLAFGPLTPLRVDRCSVKGDACAQIVWDEEKKRWRNVDGSEDETPQPPPPPPKLQHLAPLQYVSLFCTLVHFTFYTFGMPKRRRSTLNSLSSRRAATSPAASAGTAPPLPPAPASNIFKMQKGRRE